MPLTEYAISVLKDKIALSSPVKYASLFSNEKFNGAGKAVN